jgi:hypothetical protein
MIVEQLWVDVWDVWDYEWMCVGELQATAEERCRRRDGEWRGVLSEILKQVYIY